MYNGAKAPQAICFTRKPNFPTYTIVGVLTCDVKKNLHFHCIATTIFSIDRCMFVKTGLYPNVLTHLGENVEKDTFLA
jgi:hypothetical protein